MNIDKIRKATSQKKVSELEPKLEQAKLKGPGGERFVNNLTDGSESGAKFKESYLKSDISDPSEFLGTLIEDLKDQIEKNQRQGRDSIPLILEKQEAQTIKQEVDKANKSWKLEKEAMAKQEAVINKLIQDYETVINEFIEAQGTYEEIKDIEDKAKETGKALAKEIDKFSQKIKLHKLDSDIRTLEMIMKDERFQSSASNEIKEELNNALELLKNLEKLFTKSEAKGDIEVKAEVGLNIEVQKVIVGVMRGDENITGKNFLEVLGLTEIFKEGSPMFRLIEMGEKINILSQRLSEKNKENIKQDPIAEQIQKQVDAVATDFWKLILVSVINSIMEGVSSFISSLQEALGKGDENTRSKL